MKDRADQAVALINKLQDFPPLLAAQAKSLILSRPLKRRLTHCSRVACLPMTVGPAAKHQAAEENTALSILHVPADLDTVASMGLCRVAEAMKAQSG
jgi:hypothetical protein